MNAPEGIRNNNPFNLTYLASITWQGQTGYDGRFCTFDTMIDGLRAGTVDTCVHVIKDGVRPTIEALIGDPIHGQAPANENDTEAYIAAMCLRMKIARDQVFDIRDQGEMCLYARSIAIQENGATWASTISDADIEQAVTEAFTHLHWVKP